MASSTRFWLYSPLPRLLWAAEFFGSLDPEVYPSAQRITPILATHDEDEQFRAGLDLIIAGLQVQR